MIRRLLAIESLDMIESTLKHLRAHRIKAMADGEKVYVQHKSYQKAKAVYQSFITGGQSDANHPAPKRAA